MTLSEMIKQYRKARDLSQRDFARRCGLSHSLISILEMGVNPQTGKKPQPDLDTYQKLAMGMNRSVQDMFSDLGNSESVLLTTPPVSHGRKYATDSMPESVDQDLYELMRVWKVTAPEKRKSILRVIKAMSEEE